MWIILFLLWPTLTWGQELSHTLTWQDNATNEERQEIERKVGTGSFTLLSTVGPNVQTYRDTALTDGFLYTYRVRACNSVGCSAYSNEASRIAHAALPPAAPSILSVLWQRPLSISFGLVAAYSFEEVSGTTVLDATGGHHGMLVNATRVPGKIGQGLRLDGTNSYVEIGNWNVTGSAFTMMAWAKATDWKATENVRIISKANGTQEQNHWFMLGERENRARVRIKAGGSTTTVIGTVPLPINAFVHLAASYDGSFIRLFQDGVQVGSAAKTGLLNTSNVEISLGRNPVGGNYFMGVLDEIRIFDRALNQAEIQQNMNSAVLR